MHHLDSRLIAVHKNLPDWIAQDHGVGATFE
jgi:hypothetical protein